MNMTITQAGFSFFGRVGRLGYLGYALLFGLLFGVILGISAIMLVNAKNHGFKLDEVLALIFVMVSLTLIIWSALALQVKRMHDINLSGYYVAGLLAVAAIIGACKTVYPDARYVGYVVNLASTIFLFFVPGTRGRNKYDLAD
jgi:uncharacterized membrane protein YhaH (DUF805 family)